MAATFVTEDQKRAFPREIEQLLENRGFMELDVDGTEERVFGKRVDNFLDSPEPLTLRVYTSVDSRTGRLRDKGSDAIRVALFAKGRDGRAVMVGAQKRVNRVQNWKNNLRSRLDQASEMVGPRCRDGHLMALRNGSNGKFWGCSRYPKCKNTKSHE
jgi:hypothetical protein